MPQATMIVASDRIKAAQARFLDHVQARQFFKVILGASFTDSSQIAAFTHAYAESAVSCFDVAADRQVVETVDAVLSELDLPIEPVLMVSLPLDPDPHFRKIELHDPDCIRCSLCVPVCPADALTLPGADLEVSQTLCYGCGRCVPICPTDALSMLPFQVEESIADILSHPRVSAVEIHSHAIDPIMFNDFWTRWANGLRGKIVSLCFRPAGFEPEQIREFCRVALRHADNLLILQIDGAPMSGTPAPAASLPAIEAARLVQSILKEDVELSQIPITISGGINAHTANLLKEFDNGFIAGVGMGTMARTVTVQLPKEQAQRVARQLVESFQTR